MLAWGPHSQSSLPQRGQGFVQVDGGLHKHSLWNNAGPLSKQMSPLSLPLSVFHSLTLFLCPTLSPSLSLLPSLSLSLSLSLSGCVSLFLPFFSLSHWFSLSHSPFFSFFLSVLFFFSLSLFLSFFLSFCLSVTGAPLLALHNMQLTHAEMTQETLTVTFWPWSSVYEHPAVAYIILYLISQLYCSNNLTFITRKNSSL